MFPKCRNAYTQLLTDLFQRVEVLSQLQFSLSSPYKLIAQPLPCLLTHHHFSHFPSTGVSNLSNFRDKMQAPKGASDRVPFLVLENRCMVSFRRYAAGRSFFSVFFFFINSCKSLSSIRYPVLPPTFIAGNSPRLIHRLTVSTFISRRAATCSTDSHLFSCINRSVSIRVSIRPVYPN